jgi:hypothetical protein
MNGACASTRTDAGMSVGAKAGACLKFRSVATLSSKGNIFLRALWNPGCASYASVWGEFCGDHG